MAKFPALDSILATTPLALFVQRKYSLGTNTTCQVLRTGINHSYLITDDDQKYVLRIYSHQWRTEIEILEELRLLTLLKESSLSISFPLLDRSGSYIQKIDAPEGKRYAVLFSYAAGDKVRNLTEKDCHNIGLLMAQFHRITVNRTVDRIDYNTRTLTQLPYQYALRYFSESLEAMAFIKKASEYISTAFQEANTDQLHHGIVHLDIWYDNMNIDENGTITLFDFDFCGNGWLLLDLAYSTMQLFHTEPDQDQFALKRDSFYQGYEEIMSIHEEERRLLPLAGLAVWIFYLGVQSRRFDNWSNIFLTKNYLKHYIGMAKSWLGYYDIDVMKT